MIHGTEPKKQKRDKIGKKGYDNFFFSLLKIIGTNNIKNYNHHEPNFLASFFFKKKKNSLQVEKPKSQAALTLLLYLGHFKITRENYISILYLKLLEPQHIILTVIKNVCTIPKLYLNQHF